MKRYFNPNLFLMLIFITFVPGPVCSLRSQEIPTKLSLAERQQVIGEIGTLLVKNYIFADRAQKCSEYLKQRWDSGTYRSITHPRQFAEKLTEDIYSILKDKHVRVVMILPSDERLQQENPLVSFMLPLYQAAKQSGGVAEVKILTGNIGYLNLTSFEPLEISKAKIDAAMELLARVDALIIDLRENNGGNPATVQYLGSYFFDQNLLLNSFYWRRDDFTEDFWTLERVAGKKLPRLPIFILTSHFTFSAAEEFAYDLKTRRRATLIGEKTGGGANPGFTFQLNPRFNMFVPVGRAINPVTATNWEGTGVEPDIRMESSGALSFAQEKARQAARIYREKVDDQAVQFYMQLSLQIQQSESLLRADQPDSAEKILKPVLAKGVASELLDEWSINELGYHYLNQDNKPLAIAILKFNTWQYPQSANVYDSLGEAYYMARMEDLAIQNYRKSLELNPKNQNARIMLSKLGAPTGQ
jgi:tetratricopeptide (TPR) repeat protein